jgi:hypothetical protein
MKILNRKKLDRPIHTRDGDTIQLYWTDYLTGERKLLLQEPITENRIFTETMIFEMEIEGRRGLCGAFIEG